MSTLGNNIKKLRLKTEQSQGELASGAGVSQGYLSQVEAGDVGSVSLVIAFRLAEALGVTIYDLLDRKHMQIEIVPELAKRLSKMSFSRQRQLLGFLDGA